jgi:hypothetical protein
MGEEAWVTTEDLVAARERFAAAIPGYVAPASYAVARRDGDRLTYGHVNEDGTLHQLPSAVLATVCGHVSGRATYELSASQFAEAIELLAPAEAATHVDHPNLWSWRELLEGASPSSTYVVYFEMTSSPRQ